MSSPIFAERAYVSVLCPQLYAKRFCATCFKCNASIRCNGCRTIFYCSSSCKLIDWNKGQHKFQCDKELTEKAVRIVESTTVLLVHKLIKRYAEDGGSNSPEEIMDFPKKETLRGVDNLMAHRTGRTIAKAMRSYIIFVKLFEETEKKTTEQTYVDFYCILSTNATDLTEKGPDGKLLTIGQCLYLQGSRFDHSCVPDILIEEEGNGRKYFALKPFSETSEFSSLRISYDETFWKFSTSERRERLFLSHNFLCECQLCLDSTEDSIRQRSLNKICSKCDHPLIFECDFVKSVPICTNGNIICICCNEKSETKISKEEQKLINNVLMAARQERVLTEEQLLEAQNILHPLKNMNLMAGRQILFDSRIDARAAEKAENLLNSEEKLREFKIVHMNNKAACKLLKDICDTVELYGHPHGLTELANSATALACQLTASQDDEAEFWLRKAKQLWLSVKAGEKVIDFIEQVAQKYSINLQ